MATQKLAAPTDLSLPEKVVELVTVSNAALEKAAGVQKSAAAARAKVAAMIPQVCDIMVQFDRIQPNQRQKLAEALTDPVRVLELLMKTAGHRNADELNKLGSPNGQTKTAEVKQGSALSPFVGGRSSDVRDSDRALFAGLGLPVPTN